MLSTGNDQIRDPICSTTRTRLEMIDVQYFVTGRAFTRINTLTTVLLQQIFSLLETRQFSLLIFNTLDFSILHQLHIEFDQFHCQAFDWINTTQTSCDCRKVLNPAFERRRQPAFGASAIVEARLAITGLSMPTVATLRATRIKTFLDCLSAMMKIGSEDDLAGFLIDNRNA